MWVLIGLELLELRDLFKQELLLLGDLLFARLESLVFELIAQLLLVLERLGLV